MMLELAHLGPPSEQRVISVQDPAYLSALNARFAAAARHSRRVRMLRKAVPATIIAALLVVIGLSVFNPFRMLAKLPFDVGAVNVSGTKITMQSPRLAGFTNDGRPYEVHARAALQDVTNPTVMELEGMSGKIQMEDLSTIMLDSSKGTMDGKAQTLDLREKIVLKSSDYEARLTQVHVDMAKGDISSDKPVSVTFRTGTLDAQKLEIVDNGALIRFSGGVQMNLQFADPAPAQPVETPVAGAR